MGIFDSADVWELVGLYILHILSTKYGKKTFNSIHRYDGLACFENVSGPKQIKLEKILFIYLPKKFQLGIVCETNLKIVNFLDVTLDLTSGKYKPYNKPGNIPQYINVKSNHLPNIIKNLSESISRLINKLSCDISIFDSSKDLYNNALYSSDLKD